MTKKPLKTAEKPLTGSFLNSAHQIWLAGLGAFAKAEQEGGRLFETLVKEGEKIETHAKRSAGDTVEDMKVRVEETVEDVRERAADTWDGLEQVFEDRVARVLHRLGVPTYEDIQELAKRVEDLNQSVSKLTAKNLPFNK